MSGDFCEKDEESTINKQVLVKQKIAIEAALKFVNIVGRRDVRNLKRTPHVRSFRK